MTIKSWPTAIVLVTALVCLAATVLAGPSLGVEPGTVNSMLATEGGLGFLVLSVMRGLRGGGDGGSAIALVFVVGLISTTGCGVSALAIQADSAALTGRVMAETDVSMQRLRTAELDAIRDQARVECPTGCPDREAEWLGRLAETEANWRPVMQCREPVVQAVRAWIDAIELAKDAATEELGLEHALAEAARVVLLYEGFRVCVGHAVELPELPSVVTAYARRAAL